MNYSDLRYRPPTIVSSQELLSLPSPVTATALHESSRGDVPFEPHAVIGPLIQIMALSSSSDTDTDFCSALEHWRPYEAI